MSIKLSMVFRRIRLLGCVVALFAATSCADDGYQSVSNQIALAQSRQNELQDHLDDLIGECADLTGTDSCEVAVTTPSLVSPSPTIRTEGNGGESKIVCLQQDENGCQWELQLPYDPGCNAQTPSSEREFALLPCEYSYWIGFLESRLSTLGARVLKDGYYASDEIDIIKWAQGQLGVGNDGLIGSKTWRAAFSDIDCYQFDPNTGEPASMQDCYNDTNGDGMYGPGDQIPS